MSFITAWCHINGKSIHVNGAQLLENVEPSIEAFLKDIYKNLQIEYPKFYKMDMLSKTAFLASEAMKRVNPDIFTYADDQIALVFSNKNSSADTDLKFQKSYMENAAPGPALFVYTLPNILIGELAIRNKWYGENLFTVFPVFDPVFFVNYCSVLLSRQSKACLCGWVNVIDETEVFLFFVEDKMRNEQSLELNPETLNDLYTKYN